MNTPTPDTPTLKPGDPVNVTLRGGKVGRAVLVSHAPASYSDGWYVAWDPPPTEMWESCGGWQPTSALTPCEVSDA